MISWFPLQKITHFSITLSIVVELHFYKVMYLFIVFQFYLSNLNLFFINLSILIMIVIVVILSIFWKDLFFHLLSALHFGSFFTISTLLFLLFRLTGLLFEGAYLSAIHSFLVILHRVLEFRRHYSHISMFVLLSF